ncbi:MAG TPA: hypothetical protein PKM16_09975, partial [Bacteroidia bacterium]|nr:hypothetical protein [Bacteroidia bacterium]
MEFTGNEDNQISFEKGGKLTKKYRDQMSGKDIKGGYISKESLLALLNQDGCVGMRYYYGLNKEDVQELVLVGVLANMNDIINENAVCL